MLSANIITNNLPPPPTQNITKPPPPLDYFKTKQIFTFTNEFILKIMVTLNFKGNHSFRELSWNSQNNSYISILYISFDLQMEVPMLKTVKTQIRYQGLPDLLKSNFILTDITYFDTFVGNLKLQLYCSENLKNILWEYFVMPIIKKTWSYFVSFVWKCLLES